MGAVVASIDLPLGMDASPSCPYANQRGRASRGLNGREFPRFVNPRGDSTADSDAKINNFTRRTDDALAKIAKSDKPIVLGPWLSEVGFELLYWIPLVRWAIEYYGLDPHRFIVVSRGGVQDWYTDIGHRYVELFDYFSPTEFVAFNAARQKASGMQKQKGIADVELNLVDRIKMDLGFDTCDLLHPQLMYSGVLRYHWSQRSSMDHLLLHARFQRMKIPDPTDLEAQLPTNYYAVRFYSRDSFIDNEANRLFVRGLIERMLERRDVVLLDCPFALDDHENVEWMRVAGNGSRYNNRLVRADAWMEPRNNLDVQSRIIARSHCFVGTYGGLSYLARLWKAFYRLSPEGRCDGRACEYGADGVPRSSRALHPAHARRGPACRRHSLGAPLWRTPFGL